MAENVVRERSYRFAIEIIRAHRRLLKEHEFVLGRQLLRSGTSIGANVEEAQAAQSRAEFAAKMSIASKEARECSYWLRLLRDSGTVPEETVRPLLDECESLIQLLTRIVKTAQRPR